MRIFELENRLRKHAQMTKSVIQPHFDLNEEIKNMEANTVNDFKSITTLKRFFAIAAVLTLCIITVTMTPLANPIRGFFSDITRFDGAVTGTLYKNSSNEINVNAMEMTTDNDDIIALELTFKYPTEAPFAYIQEIAVADYMIIDESTGEMLYLESYPEYSGKGAIKGDKAEVNLSINGTKLKPNKEYTIVIERMYGLAKADAPLHITGRWECKLVK